MKRDEPCRGNEPSATAKALAGMVQHRRGVYEVRRSSSVFLDDDDEDADETDEAVEEEEEEAVGTDA